MGKWNKVEKGEEGGENWQLAVCNVNSQTDKLRNYGIVELLSC